MIEMCKSILPFIVNSRIFLHVGEKITHVVIYLARGQSRTKTDAKNQPSPQQVCLGFIFRRQLYIKQFRSQVPS